MSYVPPSGAVPPHLQQQQPVPPGHATVTYYAPAGQPQQQAQQLVIQQPPQGHPFRVQSYMGHIVFSCCVLLCCGGLFGCVAFILALIAHCRSVNSPKSARSLGNASVAISVAGIIVGFFILFIMLPLSPILFTKSPGRL